MERLKRMKETLMSSVENELNNICEADCEELGAAVDMIKDLSEAIYYCTIVKAMEEGDEEKYYTVPREMKYRDNMYYDENMHGTMPRSRVKYYTTLPHDKGDIKNLQDYLQELSGDIVDMIKDASKEEKQALHRKLTMLTNKVEQVVGN